MGVKLFLIGIFAVLALVLQSCTEKLDDKEQMSMLNLTEAVNISAANASIAETGDLVAVDYVGTFDNGTMFDTSIEEIGLAAGMDGKRSFTPLVFKIGSQTVVPGFENAVIGMKVNEEKQVKLLPKDAYGEWNEEFVVTVNASRVDPQALPGTYVFTNEGMPVLVVARDNETVTLDGNHPLAGQTLNFKIILKQLTQLK